jgi:hypothetical protein
MEEAFISRIVRSGEIIVCVRTIYDEGADFHAGAASADGRIADSAACIAAEAKARAWALAHGFKPV